MKKFLVILMFMFGLTLTSNAQTLYFKTTEFAIRYKTNYGWGNWSDWQPSDMKVKMDLDDDLIIIYSEKIQIYQVLRDEGNYTDDSGGKQQKFYIIDQDDDHGYLRLRIERNGNSQIYIDFNDVMWVYNVKRVS